MMNAEENRDPEEVAWEVVSFFALAPDQQERLLGPTEEWFCREAPDINPGANYLLGMACTLGEFKVSLFDSAHLREGSALFELDALIDLMVLSRDRYFWTMVELRRSPVWTLVRRLARLVLAETGLDINPPHKPLWFPDFLETERYTLRALPDLVRPHRR